MNWLCILALVFLAVKPCTAFTVGECQTHNGTLLNCSDTLQPDFPTGKDIPEGIEVLDLNINRILEINFVDISCSDIHGCDGCLKRLLLQRNEIDEIHDDAFKKLHCLQELDLSYNRIKGKTFDAVTFEGLFRLKTLKLKGNPLEVLPDFAVEFTQMRSIDNLDFSDCSITSIADNAFSDLTSLRNLILKGNKLPNLSANVFSGLHSLQFLDLRNNKISKITKGNFKSLSFLKKLLLDNNTIESLPYEAFDGLVFLASLSLADNWLKQVPYEALRSLQTLKVLNFTKNYAHWLERSPSPAEDKIPVETLYMDNMVILERISSEAFNAFPLLKNIYLRHNKDLKYIAGDAFISTGMTEVYLNDNALGSLPENLLRWEDLTVLNLENNPWNCDCNVKWMVQTHFKNATIICSSPPKLRGQNLMTLLPSDLRCPRSLMGIFLGFLIGGICLFCVGGILVVWKYRQKLICRKVKGKYISVYQKEVDDDEPSARITKEEEVPMKDTVDI